MREGAGELRHLAVLRYCRDVLQEREAEDPRRRWLWSMKRKVAVLLIKELAGRCPEAVRRAIRPLEESQKRRILAEHPLLLGDEAHIREEPFHESAEWFAEIRSKVERFMAAYSRAEALGDDAEK